MSVCKKLKRKNRFFHKQIMSKMKKFEKNAPKNFDNDQRKNLIVKSASLRKHGTAFAHTLINVGLIYLRM